MQVQELFPLELTDFERYMLVDDRDSYPMSFSLQFEFRGTIQKAAWEAAFLRALPRHPLLTASVRSGREWRRPAGLPQVAFRWQEWLDGSPVWESERIDLTHEPGLRIWTEQGFGRTRVTCQAHHACCDSFGLIAIMEDWLLAYEAELHCGGREPCWESVDPRRLTTRGAARWPNPLPEPVSRWKAVSSMCSEAARWAFRRPMPLRSGRVPRRLVGGPFPPIRSCTLSRESTEGLCLAARQSKVTLNDLLLCCLFGTLSEWNLADRSRRWLVVNVPTNLRTPEDEIMPAANVLGYAFIARRGRACRDRNTLLGSIAQETRAIRKWNLGQHFLDSLATIQRLPGVLPWLTASSRCLATTVLSNLGDVTQRFRSERLRKNGAISVGDLTLERLVGAPPLRPSTRAVFLAATCQGQLTICGRCDDRFLDDDESEALLGRFVEHLEDTAVPTER